MVPVTGGKEGYVVVHNTEEVSVTLPRRRSAMHCTVELPHFLFATVDANRTVGRLVFRCDIEGDGKSEVLATIPLSTAYAVERKRPKGLFERLLSFLWRHSDP